MNILLTNDDGYEASGITELFKSLCSEHKVLLIDPKENCSGMSAAISLRKEIEVKEISKNIFKRIVGGSFIGEPTLLSRKFSKSLKFFLVEIYWRKLS